MTWAMPLISIIMGSVLLLRASARYWLRSFSVGRTRMSL
jgi:hypothetical protein